MTEQELQNALRNLGVKLPEMDPGDCPSYLRASVYLQELTNARDFFAQTMAGTGPRGLGKNYSYVKRAVQDPALLTQLAELLDRYAVPAFVAEFAANPGISYKQYFTNTILGAQFAANVAQFRARNATVNDALTALAANFQNNILQMCQRVIRDRPAIETLFEGDFEILSLTGLIGIESTGSDFHKGGKQVLILTFSKLHSIGDVPTIGNMKVVYKPSDMEADCLIAGDSAAVNRVTRGFMSASLVEMINQAVPGVARNHPNLKPVFLPTYKILPREYFSITNPALNPAPVREPYGYSEFLTYEHSPGRSIYNYYPFGSSDFVIFPKQKPGPIIEKFYRQMGQLLAMACVFSITDMHLENVRVMGYEPHLIDLEISLTKANSSVATTGFFASALGVDAGGINGDNLPNKEWDWGFVGNPPELEREFKNKRYQNRLYTSSGTRQIVEPQANWLLRGLMAGITVLASMQQAGRFASWFQRLNHVLVRALPFDTTFFSGIRTVIFFNNPQQNPRATLAATVQANLDAQLDQEGQDYLMNHPAEPGFLALQQNHCAADYTNVDIPVFYHAIGTGDIFDSRGYTIAPPPPAPFVFTLPDQTPVQIGRPTYFNNPPPTTNAVYIQQVQGLVGQVQQRFTTWGTSVLAGLGQNGVPNHFLIQ